jgi:hypothetical protein
MKARLSNLFLISQKKISTRQIEYAKEFLFPQHFDNLTLEPTSQQLVSCIQKTSSNSRTFPEIPNLKIKADGSIDAEKLDHTNIVPGCEIIRTCIRPADLVFYSIRLGTE